jgi:putative DNA primase/helicase
MNQIEAISPWPQPEPLAQSLGYSVYPAQALPKSIFDAVAEVQRFVQAPFSLVAASALSAVSAAVQPHVDVQRGEKLVGPVSLFMLTIANSGERKSSCDNYFLEAIKEYETEQAENAKPIQSNYLAELQVWEATKKGVSSKIQSLAKSGKPAELESRKLVELQANEPLRPMTPSLLYADATPEALMHQLWSNWPSGSVNSSEAGIIFGSHGMGSDSVMRNLSMYNELWSGSNLKVDRRTSSSYTLIGARLSMGLMVQEAPLRSFFEKTGDLARGSGFLARFLIAWPESTQGIRMYVEAPKNWPSLSAFNRRISKILNTPAPINDNGQLEPKVIEFTPEAKSLWIKFHDDIEQELLPCGEMADIKDVASKAADNVARLACLFHVFEYGKDSLITADSINRAAEIVTWHLTESRRFLGEMILPPEQNDAVKLDQWIIDHCDTNNVNNVDRRTVQQYVTPVRLRKGSVLNAALERLEDAYRADVNAEGRKKIIVVNPKLLESGGIK